MGAALAAALGLPSGPAVVLADGLERIFTKRVPVLWVQGLSCTGCSVSLLNSDSPPVLQVLTEMISLAYHSTVSAAQGGDVDKVIERVGRSRDYLLVLEGAIPAEMPEACVIGGKPLEEFLRAAGEKRRGGGCRRHLCRASAGVPAAEGNPTGAIGLQEFIDPAQDPDRVAAGQLSRLPVHPSCLVAPWLTWRPGISARRSQPAHAGTLLRAFRA